MAERKMIYLDDAVKTIESFYRVDSDILKKMTFELKDLPSAQPERKKGEWIKVNGKTAINCSACYHCSWSLSFEDTVKRFNFCPNCGADMRGDKNEH